MALYPFGRSPFSRDNFWDYSPMELFDQEFGMPWEMSTRPTMRTMHPYWMMPSRIHGALNEQGASRVVNDKDRFAINLDVKHFKPEELKINTVGKMIEIQGKHEEQPDEHGYISRQFVRKYQLPEGCDPAQVQSSLSKDGVLTIQAPKKAIEGPESRPIPIQMTNQPAAIKEKDAKK